jgi:flagellar biogenesis protein FliO
MSHTRSVAGLFHIPSLVITMVVLCCSIALAPAEAFCAQEAPAIQEEFSLDEPVPQGQVIDVQHLFFKTVVLLIGICGLVVGGGYFLKRIAGGKLNSFSTDGAIILLERKFLSPKTSLWVVEVHHQPFVVVDSQYGVAIQSLQSPTESSDPDRSA